MVVSVATDPSFLICLKVISLFFFCLKKYLLNSIFSKIETLSAACECVSHPPYITTSLEFSETGPSVRHVPHMLRGLPSGQVHLRHDDAPGPHREGGAGRHHGLRGRVPFPVTFLRLLGRAFQCPSAASLPKQLHRPPLFFLFLVNFHALSPPFKHRRQIDQEYRSALPLHNQHVFGLKNEPVACIDVHVHVAAITLHLL